MNTVSTLGQLLLLLILAIGAASLPLNSQGIPAAELRAAQPESQSVHITWTCNKYPMQSCRCLSRSKMALGLKDAKADGYTSCSVYHPRK